MKRLVLEINDEMVEEYLSSEVQNRGEKMEKVILDLLQSLIKNRSPIKVQHLDPKKHSRIIKDEDLEEVSEDDRPFQDVTDTAAYAKELRKRVWK